MPERRYTRDELLMLTRQAAARYGIDPDIAVAQIQQESGFNPYARSRVGAQGIAQFMPGTWARYGKGSPLDPVAALDAWGRYMSDLLKKFKGRYDLALAGYNSGENRREYEAAARDGRPINWGVLPRGVQSETKAYVAKILANAKKKSLTPPGGSSQSSARRPGTLKPGRGSRLL
jgi:soluble lytic murein transglycosylase-like protein